MEEEHCWEMLLASKRVCPVLFECNEVAEGDSLHPSVLAPSGFPGLQGPNAAASTSVRQVEAANTVLASFSCGFNLT